MLMFYLYVKNTMYVTKYFLKNNFHGSLLANFFAVHFFFPHSGINNILQSLLA